MPTIFDQLQLDTCNKPVGRRRWLPILLVFLLIADSSSFAGAKPAPDVKLQAKTVGPNHKAIVTFTDGTERKGMLVSVDANGIVLDRGKKKGTAQYSYANIKYIQNSALTGKEKVIVAAVVVAGIAAVVSIVAIIENGKVCSAGCSIGPPLNVPAPVPAH
jgi:hypothetical protein